MNSKQSTELNQLINQKYGNITGLVIQQNNNTVYENYFNGYKEDNSVHIYSVTKSIVCILVGIAIEKGFISSVNQKVLDFFPEYKVIEGEQTIKNITIKHLLTMTAPYKYKTEPYEMFFTSPHPVKDALDLLGGEGPIGKFNYSAVGGTHILSGILTSATKQSVLNFAKANLFNPLGINVPDNITIRNKEEHISVMNNMHSKGWVIDQQGYNTASWGLFLTPLEMNKIGQLYLNHGKWDKKQIVSKDWVVESTVEHSHCIEFGNISYGYLWWLIDKDSYAAMGDGGNIIYVNKRTDTVISIAALFVPNVTDRIELIKSHIEPMLES